MLREVNGQLLDAARKAMGLTQKEVANAINTTQGTVSKYIKGNLDIPLSEMILFCTQFKISVDDFRVQKLLTVKISEGQKLLSPKYTDAGHTPIRVFSDALTTRPTIIKEMEINPGALLVPHLKVNDEFIRHLFLTCKSMDSHKTTFSPIKTTTPLKYKGIIANLKDLGFYANFTDQTYNDLTSFNMVRNNIYSQMDIELLEFMDGIAAYVAVTNSSSSIINLESSSKKLLMVIK